MTEAPIATQVREMHRESPPPTPDDPMSAFGREQEHLATVTAEETIPIGKTLPDATLLDPHGTATTLGAELGGRRAVLVFYRGAWCPYCNITLSAYQAELVDELEQRGVGLIAVSPQTPDGSLTMQEKHDLRFAVLSDPTNALAQAAGILTAPSDDVRAAQLELGLDLESVNADGTTAIPMPTTAIVDSDTTVRWIDVHPNYSTRSEPAAILAALDGLEDA